MSQGLEIPTSTLPDYRSHDVVARIPSVERHQFAASRDGLPAEVAEATTSAFHDRRSYDVAGRAPALERRQFANSHDDLSPEASELARAIDGYKLRHRRRFITFEEMLSVIKSLGYHQ